MTEYFIFNVTHTDPRGHGGECNVGNNDDSFS